MRRQAVRSHQMLREKEGLLLQTLLVVLLQPRAEPDQADEGSPVKSGQETNLIKTGSNCDPCSGWLEQCK